GYSNFVDKQNTVSVLQSTETPDTVPTALQEVAAALDGSVGSMLALALAHPAVYLHLSDVVQAPHTPHQSAEATQHALAQVAEATQNQFAQLAQAQGAEGF